MFFSSFLVTSTLPGRLGEFVRVLYVKRRGYSLGRSAVSVFVDRAQDIVFLLVMGFLGFLFFLSIVVYQVLVLIAAAGALIVLLTNRRVQRWLYSLFTGFLLPRQFMKGFASNFTDFMKDLRQLRPKTLVSTSLITVLSWLLHYTFLYLCAQAMGISLSLPYVVFIVSISTIVTTIPVSYLGIGTRDAVFLLLFEQAGLAAESAVAFSMVVLALYLIASVFGLAAWLYRP